MFLSPLFGTEMKGEGMRVRCLPRGLISLTQVFSRRMAERKRSQATRAISQSRVISHSERINAQRERPRGWIYRGPDYRIA